VPKRPADALREALLATPQRPFGYTQIMTDDTHHSTDAEDRLDDHQRAVEASQHPADALSNGDLAVVGHCSMKPAPPSSA
jgi:hypothetical protein